MGFTSFLEIDCLISQQFPALLYQPSCVFTFHCRVVLKFRIPLSIISILAGVRPETQVFLGVGHSASADAVVPLNDRQEPPLSIRMPAYRIDTDHNNE